MANRLVTTREWATARQWPSDYISLKDLQHHLIIGNDAFGRPGKAQPVLISVRLGLVDTVAASAGSDSLEGSVHYGTLGKRLAAELEAWEALAKASDDSLSVTSDASVQVTSDALGLCTALLAACHEVGAGKVATAELELRLPKATRLGQGASLRVKHAVSVASISGSATAVELALHELAIPCIIGIHPHERELKQLVIVTIVIDRSSAAEVAALSALEQLVSKTVEESSLETLEALAEEIASRIIKLFLLNQNPAAHAAGVLVILEKPAATLQSRTPVVEIYRSVDGTGTHMHPIGKRPSIPFPLPGRLDEFLQSWKQD